ncbi:MAG: DUF885 domain-containing protein [Acidimicrobiales bacterium]
MNENRNGSTANDDFAAFAKGALDDALKHRPDWATEVGDHRYDDELPGASPQALETWRTIAGKHLERLAGFDLDAINAENRVDANLLRNAFEQIAYALDELREHTWNPMASNPGRAIYGLTSRDFAPPGDRLRSLARRLAAIPGALATARSNLGAMPRVHLETALGQFAGTAALIVGEIDRLLALSPASRTEIDRVRPLALEALDAHRAWMSERLAVSERDHSFRDPRIGAERFRRKLALELDAEADAPSILARAEADLERVTEEITDAASRRLSRPPSSPDVVRDALDALAADAPNNDTILDLASSALEAQIAFVEENAVVTTYKDRFEIIPMPEIDRGVAVAYCDPPGPLESADLPTFLAVSPTPAEWTNERVASFYREYNRHLVHDLMIHEAMPGHMLQLQHSKRFNGSSPVRAAFYSGSFVEGWAVYAERVMVELGYPGNGDPSALRLQQLKLQLRMILNAILDAKIHTEGLSEDAAMKLMIGRGFQEEGEAAGKWRRALLTSTQLSTYYVGYTEVSDLAGELRRRHPDSTLRSLHDRLLGHGSPAVRHLRTLVL